MKRSSGKRLLGLLLAVILLLHTAPAVFALAQRTKKPVIHRTAGWRRSIPPIWNT